MSEVITLEHELRTKRKKSEIVAISQSPTERQREISRQLNKSFNESYKEKLIEKGFERVNIDADIKKNQIVVQKVYAVCLNGEVKIIENRNKKPLIGNSISRKIREKGMAIAMSFNIPTPILLFHNDMISTFKDGLIPKFTFAFVLGLSFNFFGVDFKKVAIGFLLFTFIALCEAILASLPNTKTECTPDDRALAKLWKYAANLVTIVGLSAVPLCFKYFFKDAEETKLTFLILHIHYVGAGFIFSSYIYNIFKYAAHANNAKMPLPNIITKYFKK